MTNDKEKAPVKRVNKSSDFIIRVFSAENANLKGFIEHIQTGQIQEFRSAEELILLLQKRMDTSKYPQQGTQIRSWNS